MRLKGKKAIVTGGASGFGEGIVRKFHSEGARVMIADIDVNGAAKLATELGVSACPADVSNRASMEALADAAIKTFGLPDILVNNAGITHLPQTADKVSEDDFDRVFAVNCKSVYISTQVFVPEMKKRESGVILNIASTAGVSPRPNLNWYNASKGWMITATRSLAVELASCGIRVNALNPVAGETPLLASFLGEDTPEMRARFLRTIPIGRFSMPEDIGNAASFLCSDEASMITGVCLEVDGGRCI